MNAQTDRDMYTLFHEGGHSFINLQWQTNHYRYRDIPSEFAEVASMSMELIATSDLSAFYSKEDAKEAFWAIRRRYLAVSLGREYRQLPT